MKKIFLIFFIIISCMFCITGCQSIDKKDAYINYTAFEKANYEYDELNNKTKVIFTATLNNKTIYSLNGFSIKVNLYYDSSIVNTEKYNYDLFVKNGDDYTGTFSFYADGKIDSFEIISLNVNYNSFWKTYKIWFIVSIILVIILIIFYSIIMIIKDLELDETYDAVLNFCDEYSWLVFILIISTGGTGVLGIISSHWVPILIVVAALLSFMMLVLIAHLIKNIVEFIMDKISFDDDGYGNYKKYLEEDDYFDNQIESVSDYIDSPEKLSFFTVQQLKEYCQENNLSGYSKLNKSGLISLILSNNCDEPEYKKTNTSRRTNKTNSLDELDKLIGLESVKIQLKRIRAILLKNKYSNEKINLHMCFYGNPGTGKTMVARLMANIFYETGALPTNKLIETDRSGLCGQYVGQTAPLTHKKVKEAMGGVLFIDEAYTLYSDPSGEDYGKEAIAALLKDMEDYKGKFCVILAGYKNEMEKLFSLNPGFESRINRKIDFPNYSIDEQMQIFDIMLKEKKYEISEEAKNKLLEVFEKKSNSKHFANARTVRNILDGIIEIQAVRTIEDEDLENDNERIIRLEDVEQYCKEN